VAGHFTAVHGASLLVALSTYLDTDELEATLGAFAA
jgi:hypothetical protein